MRIFVAFDSTVFIDAAVERVFKTLFEAIALVIVVIYLFLGNARSALIPAVTIPVCLVTAFAALWAFGFTINLLTLLAIVLCIGLVVDDAIVVAITANATCARSAPRGNERRFPEVGAALDVLDDHDRVVHHEADAQHHAPAMSAG